MTIFRENPKGLIVVLIHKETGDIHWSPVNKGEWMKVSEVSDFNEFDDNVASVLPIGEVLWLQEHCDCDRVTCGPCSKHRTGVPD